MKISINQLRAHNIQALRLSGYDADEIKVLIENLMYAQLRGNFQSIVQFVTQGYKKDPEAKPITVIKESSLSALLDGHANHGVLVMHRAMEMALVKAKEHGFGIIGAKGSSEGSGAIGFYVQHLASRGLIGWAFSGSSKHVAPFGSYQPLLGTNPIAIGIPTSDNPIVLDMATSIFPFFKVLEAHLYGKPLPEDAAYDGNGNLTTNPSEAMQGALRGLDFGPRGSGLGFIVEALTGPLVEATFANSSEDKHNYGHLIIAIDPALLTDSYAFKERMNHLRKAVKSSKKLPQIEEIFVPGERGDKHAEEALKTGHVEIHDELFKLFQQKLHLKEPSSINVIIRDDVF